MLPSAFERLPELMRQAEDRDVALFSDYDGTLTPIVERPELADLPASMREVLACLASRIPVAIISGRALADVRAKVGLPGLYYSGNHGLESCGPDESLFSEHGAHLRPALANALQRLHQDLDTLAGVIIEDKGLSASIHYRMAHPNCVPRIEQILDEVLLDQPALRKHHGKKVFEVRPAMVWHKGKVLEHLLEQMQLHDPIPLYLGDDVTDEDAFSAIHDDGVGIHIGQAPDGTSACWQLDDPAQVQEFLRALVVALDDRDAQQRRA